MKFEFASVAGALGFVGTVLNAAESGVSIKITQDNSLHSYIVELRKEDDVSTVKVSLNE